MKKSILLLACASLLTGSVAAQDAATLFFQGKDAIAKYDDLQSKAILNQAAGKADSTAIERAGYLMEGIKLLEQALPLDTVFEVDKKTGEPKIDKKTGKPKFKTKYSKDIQDLLVGHIADLGNAGNSYLQTEDYANAYDAYDAYVKALTSNLAKERNLALPDSVIGEIRFFQGYSAYMTKDYGKSYAALNESMQLGYDDNNVGAFKNSCVANIVQSYLDEKNYTDAYTYVDGIIATDNSGFIQDIRGFVVEQDKGQEAAIEVYKQAIEVDPNYGNSYYDYGRCLYAKAQAIIDANPEASNEELAPKLAPIYKEAIGVFETAEKLSPELESTRFIDDINYKLELLGAK